MSNAPTVEELASLAASANGELPEWLHGTAPIEPSLKHHASEYCAMGWQLCVLERGSKAPVAPGWNQPGNGVVNAEQLSDGVAGIGLLHAYSGTCAIDIDNIHIAKEWMSERGIDLDALLTADDAVIIDSRNPGHAKLLYRVPDGHSLPTKKVIRINKTILELRCATADGLSVQDVLPPSLHPKTGKPYKWAGKGHYSALPSLPDALLRAWQELDEGRSKSTATATAAATATATAAATAAATVDKAELVSAVSVLDPDCDRRTWVEVGMALMHALGGEGLPIWQKWSSRSATKYPGDRELMRQWASFHNDRSNPITVATIFQHAIEAGWDRPVPDVSGMFGTVPTVPASEWPEPQPIPNTLLPVLPFDYEMLPEPFVAWVKDTAERKSWSPDFLASSLMVVAATVLGRKVALYPRAGDPSWKLIPNQWAMLVGTPGAAKTPAADEVMELLKPLVASAEQHYKLSCEYYEGARRKHDRQVAVMESRCKALLSKNEEGATKEADALHDEIERKRRDFALRKPVEKRYRMDNTTAEALFDVMKGNPQGVLVYPDELMRMIRQMESDNFTTLRGLMLTAANGNSQHISDRRTNDQYNQSAHVCCSLVGTIQPGMVPTIIGNSRDGGEGDDGLPQRFGMMVWPDPVPARADGRMPDTAAEAKVRDAIARLDNIPMGADPMPFEFDSLAEDAFHEWRCRLLNDIQNGIVDPSIATYLSKYPKVIGGLALLIAKVEGKNEVDMTAWAKALRWQTYLVSHLKRVHSYATLRLDEHARNVAEKLRVGALTVTDEATGIAYTSPRELHRAGVPGVKKAKDGLELLEWLEEMGYVQRIAKGVLARVRGEAFLVNPLWAK